MKALAIIDAEIAWWEAASKAMKRPVESLALACAIGAVSALTNARNAIAIEAQRAVTVKQGAVRSTKARAEGIAQPIPRH